MSRGSYFLLILLISVLVNPFPCALACGLFNPAPQKTEKKLKVGHAACHSQSAQKSEAIPTDFKSGRLSAPSTNNCPILFVLNQGWNHSLSIPKSNEKWNQKFSPIALNSSQMVGLPLDFTRPKMIAAGKLVLPPSIPLYLKNPVLRV